jgi:hypothetical protein
MSCKQDQKRQLLILLLFTLRDIITMQGDLPEYAEALVIKDGKIEFVGASAAAMEAAGEGHQMINLEGKPCFLVLYRWSPILLIFLLKQLVHKFYHHQMAPKTFQPLLKEWNTEEIELTGWIW